MNERTYSGFPGFPGPKPDARLASEDAREQGASAPCGTCGATPETGISEGCLECEGFAPPALPSPSGPAAETLAATVGEALDELRAFIDNGDYPGSGAPMRARLVLALSALSGLVALVEQRERERDDQRTRRYELAADATRKCTEFRERAEKAEALLARHRQALEEIRDQTAASWVSEMAAAALAASAPGTEEPA